MFVYCKTTDSASSLYIIIILTEDMNYFKCLVIEQIHINMFAIAHPYPMTLKALFSLL